MKCKYGLFFIKHAVYEALHTRNQLVSITTQYLNVKQAKK